MIKLQKFNQLGILTTSCNSIHYFVQQFFQAIKPFATSKVFFQFVDDFRIELLV